MDRRLLFVTPLGPALLPLVALGLACHRGQEAPSPPGPMPPVLSGPEGDGGVLIDASSGDDPFGDGGAGDADTPADASMPCDDTIGDLSACSASADAGASSCLSAARCQQLTQDLLPRSAGLAMSCLDGLPDGCPSDAIADCFLAAAGMACAPAAPGTPPCDAMATLCASEDPWGMVQQCLAMASALTPAAASALETCLNGGGACDPDTLSACAATLFP